MIQPYDFLVFIGRFQPFHNGHLSVIQQGLSKAQQLIVLCGSAHQPRSTRNPWLVHEREAMIRSAVNDSDQARLHVAPLMDTLYNDESWMRSVQSIVHRIVSANYGGDPSTAEIGLIGHSKDQSAYYLSLFPQWGNIEVDNYQGLSATPIREGLLSHSADDYLRETLHSVVPMGVRDQLESFRQSKPYAHLQEEYAFVDQYKQAWQGAPYTPTFVTVDAVVIQSGHVLMVKRKAKPGKGLLALPGGFVGQDETLLDACLRELKEETRLKVPVPVLKGSIKNQRVFDDPFRSARGRTITHAFHMELAPSTALPKVKGGDDAKHALWVPLANIDSNTIFEDHFFIIQALTGL